MANSTCTISVPGYRLERNCTLICHQAEWTDVALFYLGNYVAHVATIKHHPGSEWSIFLYATVALIFPLFGMYRGLLSIGSYTIFAPTSLQKAARAGVLLMVVPHKTPDNPDGDMQEHAILLNNLEAGRIDDDTSTNPTSTPNKSEYSSEYIKKYDNIHGSCKIPDGYRLRLVPANASFTNEHTKISCDYSIIRIVVSIVQLVFAVTTLVRTRGDQIKKFGYASFGLTVFPYAWMSLINLGASLMVPEYATMYVVESASLREARRLHPETCIVTGTVGELQEKEGETRAEAEARLTRLDEISSKKDDHTLYLALFLGTVVPIAVLGGVSRFSPGTSSTYSQRVWIMSWFFLGMGGFVLGMFTLVVEKMRWLVLGFLILLACLVLAIGGIVVVGQMILQFGVCVRISG